MVSGDEPQVHLGTVNNFTPTLDVYLTSGQERFRFPWEDNVKEWIGLITEAITGKPAPKKSDDDWLAEAAAMAESVAGSINKLKSAFGMKSTEQASGKCPNCGASITGIVGATTQCPYCGPAHTCNCK